jgi:hypothetical protein
MASITTISEVMEICVKANITLQIWGKHGLGKSSLVSQYCMANRMGCINKRASQIEGVDLKGNPYADTTANKTRYLAPEDLPTGDLTWEQAQEMVLAEKDPRKQNILAEQLQGRIESGILFLDESFRGADDVIQAMFELVLEGKCGNYVLPPKWGIVCANNFFEGDYQVNTFNDAALLDRFCHVTLSSDEEHTKEWVGYMVEKHGDAASEIIEFCAASPENLYGRGSINDLGFSITPSPRSWDMVGRALDVCSKGDYSDSARQEVLAGLIGRSLQTAFSEYSCPVKPRDVIDNGVKKIAKKLASLERNQYVGLTWALGATLASKMNDEKHINVALDFSEWVLHNTKEKDIVIAFLTNLATNESGNERQARTRSAALANPKVAALVNKAEKKLGKNMTLLGELQKRPELAELVSKTSWGKDV